MINKIYGVAKAYVTRVGEGCFPTEEMGPDGETLGVKGKEFGATTNRKRRCGWFDAVAMRYAQAMNGFDSVLLNKLDILSGFSTIKVARAYVSNRGDQVDHFPTFFKPEDNLKPVYEEFEGWSEDISDVQCFSSLPQAAQTYIRGVEHLSNIKISFIGNGPNKENYIACS